MGLGNPQTQTRYSDLFIAFIAVKDQTSPIPIEVFPVSTSSFCSSPAIHRP